MTHDPIRQTFHQNDIMRPRSAQVSPMKPSGLTLAFTLQGSQVRNLHFPPEFQVISITTQKADLFKDRLFCWG
jgi:hypothetical protein